MYMIHIFTDMIHFMFFERMYSHKTNVNLIAWKNKGI